MRLHLLEITAFGPYAGTEVIDMDALTASGLFLLEGPTGAGKSTILDAVTFALYGSTASSSASEDRLHSDFADPGTTPSVTLDLTVGEERLRVRRVPQHERPRLRGTGTTIEASSVHLERHDGAGWTSISSNKAEVGTFLSGRIGLSAEQFTQVVLLPQGEFATFLKADDNARRALLTTIFGTSMFDQVIRELEARRKEAGHRRDEARTAVGSAVAVAVEAAGLEGAEADEVRALPDLQRGAGLDAVAQGLAARSATAARTLADAETARAAAALWHSAADRTHSLLAELAAARGAVAAREATRPEHEARVEELRGARAAAPVAVLLDQLADSAVAVDSALSGLASAAEGLGLAVDDLGASSGAAQRGLATADDEQAAMLERLVVLEDELDTRRAALVVARTALDSATARLAALETERDALPQQILDAEQALAVTRTAAERIDTATAALAAARTRLTAAEDLAALEPRVAAAAAAHRRADDAHRAADRTHLELLRRHLDGIAAVLAVRLVPGGACPVCGGTDHPSPAQPGPETVTAEAVDSAEAAVVAAREIAEHTKHDLDELGLRRADLAARADGADVDSLRAEHAQSGEAVAAAEAAAVRLTALEPELAALRARRETLQREVTAATASFAEQRQAVESDTADADRDGAELVAARGEHPTVAARREALRASAGRRRSAADSLDVLRTAVSSRDDLRTRAAAAAAAAGLADLDGAAAARRRTADVVALEATVAGWERRTAEVSAGAADPRFAGLDPAGLAGAATELGSAVADLAAREVERLAAVSAADAAQVRVARFAACRADLAAAESRLAAVLADTEAVFRLAGLANGTRGALPMSLTTYVLRSWFDQVVQAANHRLGTMSAGRYELERVDEAEKGDKRTGLSLRVVDRHTGESRSPKSLSGGETFYTSLALALGLADVVRAGAGGVELDTLFIDEGFGTLDSETLDQVMAVIDELRNGGRVVGIVSHVADLKERIPERLEVRRRDDGSSLTRVVA